MKKSSLAVVIVAALAVGYPAAAWITGKRLEVKLTEDNQKAAKQPGIKLVNESYERGIFSSVQKGTVQFVVGGMGKNQTQNLEMRKAMGVDAFQISYVNKITHGPVPGIFGVAAGKVETELVIDPKILEEIKKVFGEKKFLEMTTILNYTGGGTLKLSSPAVAAKVGVSQDQLDWKGVKGELDFNEAYTQFKMNFVAPGFELTSANGSSAKMGEMKLVGNADRLSVEHALYTGKTRMSMQSFTAKAIAGGTNNQVDLADIKFESDSSLTNDLYKSALKFGIGKLNINSTEFTNVHFDYSLNNLHGPSAESLLKEFDKTLIGAGEADANADNKWLSLVKVIIQHKPEILLDKFSIAGKTGDLNMHGKLTLAPVTDEDLHSLPMIFSKLIGHVETTFSEDFVIEIMNASIKDPKSLAQVKASFDMQLKGFETQGYLKRNGKTLTSTVDWKNSALLVNGLAFPPAPAMHGDAVEEMEEEIEE